MSLSVLEEEDQRARMSWRSRRASDAPVRVRLSTTLACKTPSTSPKASTSSARRHTDHTLRYVFLACLLVVVVFGGVIVYVLYELLHPQPSETHLKRFSGPRVPSPGGKGDRNSPHGLSGWLRTRNYGLNSANFGLHPVTEVIATPQPSLYTQHLADGRPLHLPPALSRSPGALHLGETAPEEPQRLPGLTTRFRKYTPSELLQSFGNSDIVYRAKNSNDANNYYRLAFLRECGSLILTLENATYQTQGVLFPLLRRWAPDTKPPCLPQVLENSSAISATLNDLMQAFEPAAGMPVDNRDRETDELRHSIRSVEQHIQWHRGRVVMVSPGHHPTWVDGAKNFLAGTCGGAAVQALRTRGTHLRLTTVHQDAIMPYGMRFTADSHTIEQHIWRVKNTSAVHVYMNDDYFVNRDVAITDLFNEYGGTIVHAEPKAIGNGVEGSMRESNVASAQRHSQWFTTLELDVDREDALPQELEIHWGQQQQQRNKSNAPRMFSPGSLSHQIDVAHAFASATRPPAVQPRRHRFHAIHGPFAYCTNMFRFFETRYEREFAYNALRHRLPMSRDVLLPYLYNAFIMARPWQASPQFLPYLVELHRLQRDGAADKSALVADIALDNFDGCAPASLAHGQLFAAEVHLEGDVQESAVVAAVQSSSAANPLFLSVRTTNVPDATTGLLRNALTQKFPTAAYLEMERDAAAEVKETGHFVDVFKQLMRLPVYALVSYTEGVCPLVRSLAFAFAGHHIGHVHAAVQSDDQTGLADTLRNARKVVEHRIISALPVPQCAFRPTVRINVISPSASLLSFVHLTMNNSATSDAGVTLPSTCGGAVEGLRVRGFVVDARTPNAPVTTAAALREALAMPGQTLALEDFRAVRVGPEERDVVLVLSREDAEAKAVHWITGASENDLLLTYPLPVRAYEDMNASLKWILP